jgi:hypothetical protein
VLDPFSSFSRGVTSPATRAFAVAPADGTQLPYLTRAIYVGGSGDLTVTTEDGDTVTFKSVPTGTVLSVRVQIIAATGTTATNLIGLA